RVVGLQVDRPRVGRAALAVVAHAAGDLLAALGEGDVVGELWPHALGVPAEEVAVEGAAAVGVRGVELDPDGRPDGGGVTMRHERLLRISRRCRPYDHASGRNSSPLGGPLRPPAAGYAELRR